VKPPEKDYRPGAHSATGPASASGPGDFLSIPAGTPTVFQFRSSMDRVSQPVAAPNNPKGRVPRACPWESIQKKADAQATAIPLSSAVFSKLYQVTLEKSLESFVQSVSFCPFLRSSTA
jgi:hypothetical protein